MVGGDESLFRTAITTILPTLYILRHRREKLRVCSAADRHNAVESSYFLVLAPHGGIF